MKKISISVMLLWVFFCVNIYSSYSQPQVAPVPLKPATKSVDVNRDGEPDVIYYSDGKYVSKIEADTNYDGKPDVKVHLKDGKFQSAEVDSNYDGKMDKRFSNVKEFNQWLNEERPDFKDKLNRPDWQFDLINF